MVSNRVSIRVRDGFGFEFSGFSVLSGTISSAQHYTYS